MKNKRKIRLIFKEGFHFKEGNVFFCAKLARSVFLMETQLSVKDKKDNKYKFMTGWVLQSGLCLWLRVSRSQHLHTPNSMALYSFVVRTVLDHLEALERRNSIIFI